MTQTVFDPHNAIEASGLVKTYPGDVRALDGLDLEVEAGTVFGLLGPNGAGKSTTVRILTTLSRPDAGSARVAGLDVLAEPVRVRHAIGVVGQKHGVDPDASGRENLVLQGEFYGHHRRGAAAAGGRAARALRARRRRPRGRSRPTPAACSAARRGDGPHPPPAGAVPRRADHRPRPGGARADVGGDRAARARGGHDDPAHHALPRGGRPAGRRSSRSSTAGGSSPAARRTRSRASCAATPSRSSSPATTARPPWPRWSGSRRRGEVALDGRTAARPRRRRRGRGAGRARRAGGARRARVRR